MYPFSNHIITIEINNKTVFVGKSDQIAKMKIGEKLAPAKIRNKIGELLVKGSALAATKVTSASFSLPVGEDKITVRADVDTDTIKPKKVKAVKA